MPKREARILERSYRSPIDRAREPYVVYLPRRYAPGKCPLLAWLHGFGSGAGAGLDDFFMDLADDFGYVLAVPRGKGSVFYDGPGELDVMEVVRRVRREFGTLPGRTFVGGASMGGTGRSGSRRATRTSSRRPSPSAAGRSPDTGTASGTARPTHRTKCTGHTRRSSPGPIRSGLSATCFTSPST